MYDFHAYQVGSPRRRLSFAASPLILSTPASLSLLLSPPLLLACVGAASSALCPCTCDACVFLMPTFARRRRLFPSGREGKGDLTLCLPSLPQAYCGSRGDPRQPITLISASSEALEARGMESILLFPFYNNYCCHRLICVSHSFPRL